MPRYRLLLTPDQEVGLVEHCQHARFVWNLAVEQHADWRPGRVSAPGYVEQARQLTEARAEFAWLRAVTVQRQALRDLAQAMRNFFARTRRRPSWRKAGRDEGFRQVAVRPEHVRRLNRGLGRMWVPKVGWVRFRWSRAVPDEVKSYRVTRDRAGRWHVAFAAIPDPVPAPGNGGERQRLRRLQRRLARCRRGSHRRRQVKAAIAKLRAREADRRKDWVEQTSTDLARRFDLIRVEELDVRNMTRSARGTVDQPGRRVRQKAGLNRGILADAWSRLVTRLEHKARSRVEKVTAARNIAAGRAVTARGALQPSGGAMNREPHPATSTA